MTGRRVVRSVCLLGTTVSAAEMAKPIEMPFWEVADSWTNLFTQSHHWCHLANTIERLSVPRIGQQHVHCTGATVPIGLLVADAVECHINMLHENLPSPSRQLFVKILCY